MTNAPLSPAIIDELRAALACESRFDDMTLGLYSTDASIYQIRPLGVVLPRSSDDVAAVLSVAQRHGLPVLARGSGTSLSGQAVAAALVLDFSKEMQRILDIDPVRRLVRVQPGVVLDALNAALQPHGLQFGPDVATSNRANIGGMIGNNSAGSRSVQQGKTIDHVRELEAWLVDGTVLHTRPLSQSELAATMARTDRVGAVHAGVQRIVSENRQEIISRYPRVLRRVSGYNLDAFLPELQSQVPRAPVPEQLDRDWPDRRDWNLSSLLVGAEGTLGVVTEAVLHVVPLPLFRRVALLEFQTIDAALQATPTLLELKPTAIELLDRHIVELSRQNLKYRESLAFVRGTPDALLIVELSGDVEGEVQAALDHLTEMARGLAGLLRVLPAQTDEQRQQIWNCRKAGAPLLLGIPGARKPIAFVEDTAVSPERLADFTRRFRAILDRHGVMGAYYGHASVGCLHIRPMLDAKSAADLGVLRAVSDAVADLVLEFGGAMSGEHGDGLARSYHNLKLFGPKLFHAFGEVKQLFDPAGLLNPGKIINGPSPTSHLRAAAEIEGPAGQRFLDFSREARQAGTSGDGWLAAAEACNGSAVCRKTATGTMCPSYMVTRDEEHTPRGRANALRLALSGQLGPHALTSPRLHEVMDLCLMCKACKSECPSNVDVAKLKTEFLAHYNAVHPPSLGARLLAHAGTINRLASATAPVANWAARQRWFKALLESLTGLDRRRSLPHFAYRSFAAWHRRHRPLHQAGSRGRVVLLDDCLTSHCEPHIGRAAVELLETAGHAVDRAGLWCCGRPLLSKGFLSEAKQLARKNLDRLSRWTAAGIPVLGLEPSCTLTLIDEYPDLCPGPQADQVRGLTFLADQWLGARLAEADPPIVFRPRPAAALWHGHCQQKALLGSQASIQALRHIPGLTVRELDAGCCGMAGTFGYDHYDVSQAIGERILFPEVRKHAGLIVAPGFSCRHQIADATQAAAIHPLVLLADQMPLSG